MSAWAQAHDFFGKPFSRPSEKKGYADSNPFASSSSSRPGNQSSSGANPGNPFASNKGVPLGLHAASAPSPFDDAKDHFAILDRCEQEVEVLEALKQVASQHLSKALASENEKSAEDQAGDLCVRVIEASTTNADQVRDHQICIELECQGYPARSEFREGAEHHFWNETFDLPLDEGAVMSKEAYLRIAIVREDGRVLGARTEPVANLRDQRVQQRWCDFHNGWRVNVALQWINSRAELLQAHLQEFEVRLEKAREELLHAMDKVQHFVPPDVWHDGAAGGGGHH